MISVQTARFGAAWGLAAVCFLTTTCGTPSEEARIRELLKDSARLAEKKEIRALSEIFSPDYSDFEGRDKEATVQLITDYLERFRGVVVHLLGARVGTIETDGRVSVECEFSLSHGAAEVLRKLIRYTGEYYRFRIELQKNRRQEWRFIYAEWRSITVVDLFPESLEILRKLFPER